MLFQHCAALDLWIRRVPSHIPVHLAEDAFEEWAIIWNSKIDELAVLAHRSRFWTLLRDYEAELDWWPLRLRPLRAFYFGVAAGKRASSAGSTEHQSLPPVVIEDDDEEATHFEPHGMLEDSRPVNWQSRCKEPDPRVSSVFMIDLVTWWCDLEILGGTVQILSEIEFVFALVLTPGFSFSFQAGGSKCLGAPSFGGYVPETYGCSSFE